MKQNKNSDEQLVTKAVIPAAGLGTRFLPVTKSMPKEMLPIINKPVIQYVVEEAVQSGIDDIIMITGRTKRSIEDYFDDAPELTAHLQKKGKDEACKMIEEVSSLADIHFIRQKEPKGLGDAVLRAEKHIGNEPFAVLLGDDFVVSQVPCIRQLISVYAEHKSSVVAVENVPPEKISSYGIIDGQPAGTTEGNRLYALSNIVEKPRPEDAPSSLGAIGRYVFTPEIFTCLKRTTQGVGGEIQLTDAIRRLIETDGQNVFGSLFSGIRYDTGDVFGYLKTILDCALRDENIADKLRTYLKEIN